MALKLRPFQETGRDFLSARAGALLADQPGLGKTAQAIAAADDRGAQRVVVICPASLKTNWQREIARFSAFPGRVSLPSAGQVLDKSVRWTVVNYDIARLPALRFQLAALKPDVLVCDEMHRLKGGPDTSIGAAFLDSLAPSAGAVWGLSGTPAPNNVSELFWWISATCPQAFAGMDFYRFLARYTSYRDTPYGIKVDRNKNTDEFRERIAPYFLRRLVREVVPELPPLQIEHLVVDPKTTGLGSLEKHPEYRELAGLLETLAGDDGVELSADQYATVRRLTGLLKVEPYANVLADELSADETRKIVVMCWHREVIESLASALHDFGVVVVHGGTSQKDRQAAVDSFQNAAHCSRVFIGQIVAAGEGLTLTAANQVDVLESNWVPKDIEQAMRRVLRIGQKADRCVGRFVSLARSIDELIGQVLEKKTRLLMQVFD